MSLEKILIIKQYRENDIANCKTWLESSPEKYSVIIANNYQEGSHLLKECFTDDEDRFRVVIIDADKVEHYTLDLLEVIRAGNLHKGSNEFLPVIVMTSFANDETRKALTAKSSECIIKTGKYDKFLWNAVKSSLERNPESPRPRVKRSMRTSFHFPKKSM